MSDGLAVPGEVLPRRTWRRWWQMWPKWLRIGLWGAAVMVALQLAILLRIAIGLIESPTVTSFRRPGVDISYHDGIGKSPERFRGHRLLFTGLFGRSPANVESIFIDHATDSELTYIGRHFRNLIHLEIVHSDVTAAGYSALRNCRELQSLEVTFGSEMDDEGFAQLTELRKLTVLNLPGTLVTDEIVPLLSAFPRLQGLNLFEADVTRQAVDAWRAQHPHRNIEIVTSRSTQSNDALYCSVRYADGARTASFHAPYQLIVEVPDTADGNRRRVFDEGQESERWVIFPQHHLKDCGDGEYRFQLILGGIESDPVTVEIRDGQRSTGTLEFRLPVKKADLNPRSLPSGGR